MKEWRETLCWFRGKAPGAGCWAEGECYHCVAGTVGLAFSSCSWFDLCAWLSESWSPWKFAGDVVREGQGSPSVPSHHFVLIIQAHSMGEWILGGAESLEWCKMKSYLLGSFVMGSGRSPSPPYTSLPRVSESLLSHRAWPSSFCTRVHRMSSDRDVTFVLWNSSTSSSTLQQQNSPWRRCLVLKFGSLNSTTNP